MAANRTTNPLLLALLAITLRVMFQVLLGGGTPGRTVLFTLPEIPLPSGSSGVRLGGPVTLEGVLAAAYEGARLAAVLACIGAANTLASPRRLLRYVPATLYEVGTALVVALTYAPQLVDDARRVRVARRLRGHGGRGIRELARLAVPVLDSALERSLDLAASMESRGYGRSVHRNAGSRRKATALTLFGLGGVVAGVYGLLDGGSAPLLGLPLLVVGSAAAAASLAVGARRERRSRYRPDPWAAPEWVVLGSGAAAGIFVLVAEQRGVSGIVVQTSPAEWPMLPALPALGLLLGLLPAWLSPLPPVRALERAGGLQDKHSPNAHTRNVHSGDVGTQDSHKSVGSAS